MADAATTGALRGPERRNDTALPLGHRFASLLDGIDLQADSVGGRLALLRVLYAAGRNDLAFARLLEGHVDALQIIARTATCDAARERLRALTKSEASLGVWNADLKDAPLSLNDGRLFGGKAFASGAGLLSHALVTVCAGDKDKVQLLLIDLERMPPKIDTGWWDVVGMQASETHLVRWAGAKVSGADLIGGPGDYEAEPWFSGGALRFVAAQAGGIASIFDHVKDQLVDLGRADQPDQSSRLAELYSCAHLSASVVREAAERWETAQTNEKLDLVRHARMSVLTFGEKAIQLAQQSVGVQAHFKAHPLSAALTNLMVYLRQPAPDAQKHAVAAAAASGRLTPRL